MSAVGPATVLSGGAEWVGTLGSKGLELSSERGLLKLLVTVTVTVREVASKCKVRGS